MVFQHGTGHVTLHAIGLLCTSSGLILVQFPMLLRCELHVHSHNPYTWQQVVLPLATTSSPVISTHSLAKLCWPYVCV